MIGRDHWRPVIPNYPRLPPNEARRLHHEFELAPLNILVDWVAGELRREAALRAQRELFERYVLRGLIDSAAEPIDGLHVGDFRTHQPEHHDLAAGYEPQRRKTARAGIVVLEQKTLMIKIGKEPLG